MGKTTGELKNPDLLTRQRREPTRLKVTQFDPSRGFPDGLHRLPVVEGSRLAP